MPEHDPFDSLKATMTTPSSDLRPLPATEVRRRGDRLRRRNTALAVAGGTVAAMTAVGVPLALTQGGDADRDSVPIATDGPSPAAAQWRTEVPEDFPLTAGFPADQSRTQVLEDPQAQAVGPCATAPAWDVSGALDSLQAIYTDPSEGGLDRTVSVYEDDLAAVAAMEGLRTEVESCRPQG